MDMPQPEPAPASTKIKYFASIGVLIAAAFVIIFLFINFSQAQKQQTTTEENVKKTAELSEQVKTLVEQNTKLTQQTANYAYCNSVILARYTQTGEPIDIEDLNTCVLNAFPNSSIDTPEGIPDTNAAPSTSTQGAPQSVAPSRSNATPTPSPSPIAPSSPSVPLNPTTPATPAPSPSPTANSSGLNTTPTGILPGITLRLPCLNALNAIRLGC